MLDRNPIAVRVRSKSLRVAGPERLSCRSSPAFDPVQTLVLRRPGFAVERVADTRRGLELQILSPEFPKYCHADWPISAICFSMLFYRTSSAFFIASCLTLSHFSTYPLLLPLRACL